MKKSIILFDALKHLLTEEDIQKIGTQHGYQEVGRKMTFAVLLRVLILSAVHEWKSFRHAADVAETHGVPEIHFSALSKKASQVPYGMMKDVFSLALSRCNRHFRRATRFPKELLLVDSTTMTVGENRLPWAPYHGQRAGVKLHVALLEATQMPQKVVETTGLHHDSPVMDEFLDPRFILVADRAYFQIKRIDDFHTRQPFVIRVKMNVELTKRKSLRRFKELDSNVTDDVTCHLGTLQKRSKHRHRIVEFTDLKGNIMRVVTNLRHVSAEKIAAMYQARWAIEVFFRWVKQHLNVPTLFGTTENAVFNQLYAALLAYILLKTLYEYGRHRPYVKKISFVSFTRQLIEGELSVEWQMSLQDFFKEWQRLYGIHLSKTG